MRLAERAPAAGAPPAGLALLVLGLLHGVLLFSGDILGAYGLVALLIAPALARDGAGPASSRTLLGAAGVITVMAVILGSFTGLPQRVPTEPTIALSTYLAALAAHPAAWLNTTLYSALLTAPGVLVGVVIARRGIPR